MHKENLEKEEKKKNHLFLLAGMLICIAVMAVSAFQLVRTFLAYRAGEKEYDSLKQYTAEVQKAPDSETGGEKIQEAGQAENTEEGVISPPIEVDFASLQEINADIVGWIYIGALEISYPVVQGEDDDEYLHRTFERQDNFAGSIFVEAENAGDFSDPNTIIYGHNMKNQTMFGKLRTLLSKNLWQEDPYFWILTPDGNYRYRMFSLHEVRTSSDVYALFGGADDSFVQWAENMQADSAADLEDVSFTAESRVVTLSTCTQDEDSRFVVQGVRVDDAVE